MTCAMRCGEQAITFVYLWTRRVLSRENGRRRRQGGRPAGSLDTEYDRRSRSYYSSITNSYREATMEATSESSTSFVLYLVRFRYSTGPEGTRRAHASQTCTTRDAVSRAAMPCAVCRNYTPLLSTVAPWCLVVTRTKSKTAGEGHVARRL